MPNGKGSFLPRKVSMLRAPWLFFQKGSWRTFKGLAREGSSHLLALRAHAFRVRLSNCQLLAFFWGGGSFFQLNELECRSFGPPCFSPLVSALLFWATRRSDSGLRTGLGARRHGVCLGAGSGELRAWQTGELGTGGPLKEIKT